MFAALLERVPTTWAPAQGFLTSARSRIAIDAVNLADWLQRAGCGLEGHVMVLNLEPRKMSLRCMHCGQRTPGWSLDEQHQ